MREISVEEFMKINPFTKIEKNWALLTAGDMNGFNSMTVNWFTLGYLWHKYVAVVYVRPQRYTYNFSETKDYITLSFYDEEYRQALGLFGSKSGKDCDKVKETNFHPVAMSNGVSYEEASITLVGKKIYRNEIKENEFLNKEVMDFNYPDKDFHTCYVLEIEHIYVK